MPTNPEPESEKHDDESLRRLAKLPRMTHAELVEKLRRERAEGASRAKPAQKDTGAA